MTTTSGTLPVRTIPSHGSRGSARARHPARQGRRKSPAPRSRAAASPAPQKACNLSRAMRVMTCLLLVLVASTASAQDATEYRDLRAARPDGRRVPVKDLVLERDAFRITLQSGVVHLLAPLGKDTFGAVFIGQGNYLL